jgi:hypothetical protein
MTHTSVRRLQAAGLGVFVPLSLVMTVGWVGAAKRDPIGSDFAAYYAIGRSAWDHGLHSIYDLGIQREEFQSLGNLPWYPSAQTPVLAFIAAPFALVPFWLAYPLWLILICGALFGAWWLVAPGGSMSRTLYLLSALALLPMTTALYNGQAAVLIMFALAAICALLESGREREAGLILAVAVLLKPQDCALVPLALLLTPHRRSFLWFGAGALAIGAVSALTVGLPALMEYGQRILQASSSGAPWLVLTGVSLPYPKVAALGVVPIMMVVIWRNHGQTGVAIAVAEISTILLSPFLHLSDLVALLVPAWMLLRAGRSAWLAPILALGYIALDLVQAGYGWLLVTVEVLVLCGLLIKPLSERPATEARSSAPDLSIPTPA